MNIWWISVIAILGGWVFTAILFMLWYSLTNQLLKRRYKEEDDRGRDGNKFGESESTTVSGVGDGIPEERQLLSDEVVDSFRSDSGEINTNTSNTSNTSTPYTPPTNIPPLPIRRRVL